MWIFANEFMRNGVHDGFARVAKGGLVWVQVLDVEEHRQRAARAVAIRDSASSYAVSGMMNGEAVFSSANRAFRAKT